VVCHRSRGSWEPIFEREYLGNRAYVRFGESEWRLKSQVLHNASVFAGVVVNSVSAANNGFLHRPPRESHAWSEVVAIRFDDGDRECPGKCSRAAGKHRRRRGDRGIQVKIHDAVVRLAERRDVFVPQSQVETQTSGDAPGILNEQIPGVLAEVVGCAAALNRSLLRQPQQEIGEIVAAAGAGERTRIGEGEGPARVLGTANVVVDPAKIA